MRKGLIWISLLVIVFALIGCLNGANSSKFARSVFGSSNGVIPSPQPGLTLIINQSPAVWAKCSLFRGHINERDLIIANPAQRGKLAFSEEPISIFEIDPPIGVVKVNNVPAFARFIPAILDSPEEFTLLVFYTNFSKEVIEWEIIHFHTTGYPLNDYYVSGRRKIYSDVVIELLKLKPYPHRQFTFNRTYYPGHVLLKMLGLN